MIQTLSELESRGDEIRVAMIGCGKMGRGMVYQMEYMKGIRYRVIVEHTPQKAVDALLTAGISRQDICVTDKYEEAALAMEMGRTVVTGDETLAYRLPTIQVVVEATGRPATGATIALAAMDHGKHVIMLNVECDSVVGPALYAYSKKKGVVYTCSYGDEPGAIMDLVDYIQEIGLDLLLVGKGKNNVLNREATAESLAEEAAERKLSPKMLTSFVDGTNTMLELACTANALGFVPDVIGGHGITTDPSRIAADYNLKEEGGVLSRFGVVDYAFGMAPGVFALATTESEGIRELMKYMGMGSGPNFSFFRPYHLCCIETPRTMYRAFCLGETTLVAKHGQVTDAVAVAKRDIQEGESLGGIGSAQTYALMCTHEEAKEKGWLPISLVTERARALCSIPKGTMICYNMVSLDEDETIVRLRRQQDAEE